VWETIQKSIAIKYGRLQLHVISLVKVVFMASYRLVANLCISYIDKTKLKLKIKIK